MSNNRSRRQEIYDRVRQTSKDEYIISEMKRLGFWPSNEEKPSAAEELITRRAQLNKELNALAREKALYDDPEKALKELHKQRKKEALEKREETRKRRNQERYDRSLAWHEKQKNEITWLGKGISLGLDQHEFNQDRLSAQRLPIIENSTQLADAMGISLSELRFIAYKKRVSQYSHYQHFSIPKKTGGVRNISAPMPRLKRAQYWLLDNLFSKLTIHSAAHGFIVGRSIVSNAEAHVGKDVVINMDLENFFPTITFGRVKGLVKSFGYSEALATTIAAICTDAEQALVELDGQDYYVDQSVHRLPQGAPTSPVISNLICRRLDPRIQGAAQALGFTYTRYADDLSFSGNGKSGNDVQQLLWRVKQIISAEGFNVHPKKTRIMRKHRHQEVTGVVVNKKLNVDRKTLKKFRALLYQIEQNGPEGKHWGNGELFSAIHGYANFVAMVNPAKGQFLRQQVLSLIQRYKPQANQYRSTRPGESFRALSAAAKAPSENWWQATEKAVPVLEKTKAEIEAEKKAIRDEKKQARQAATTQQNTSSRQSNSRENRSVSNENDANNQVEGKGESKFGIFRWLIFLYIVFIIVKVIFRS